MKRSFGTNPSPRHHGTLQSRGTGRPVKSSGRPLRLAGPGAAALFCPAGLRCRGWVTAAIARISRGYYLKERGGGRRRSGPQGTAAGRPGVGRGVPAGEWTGRGAALLGLSGQVTEAEMEALFGQGPAPAPGDPRPRRTRGRSASGAIGAGVHLSEVRPRPGAGGAGARGAGQLRRRCGGGRRRSEGRSPGSMWCCGRWRRCRCCGRWGTTPLLPRSTPARLDEKWCGDITYVQVGGVSVSGLRLGHLLAPGARLVNGHAHADRAGHREDNVAPGHRPRRAPRLLGPANARL